ncbi:DUF2971 domain-containing protein [Aquibium microcysteis]|uniref:DUF2971 domain-containing protein n=1 Tax=Aquibium microcysteis TaxID=675281 RepID=UPI00165CFCA9|nr:DUF2971 domain-containing protein [Aquibium microcysteis]
MTNLAAGRLKFSPIAELNDPSEMLPTFRERAFLDSLEAIRKTGFSEDQFRWLGHQNAILQKLAPNMQAVPLPSSRQAANELIRAAAVYENAEYMKRTFARTVDLIRGSVGVLCLTERYGSLPMWAHYANMAKGFVVRFDGLRGCFAGDETGSLKALKAVRYVDQFEGMTYDPSSQDNLFFSKLSDWAYEREWRVVLALSDCTSSDTLHLYEIDPHHVTEIICGWNVAAEDIEALRADLPPHIAVTGARLEEGQVTSHAIPPQHSDRS